MLYDRHKNMHHDVKLPKNNNKKFFHYLQNGNRAVAVESSFGDIFTVRSQNSRAFFQRPKEFDKTEITPELQN